MNARIFRQRRSRLLVSALAVAMLTSVAFLGDSARAADLQPPQTSVTVPTLNQVFSGAGPFVLSGSASDDVAVTRVNVAVQDRTSGRWLRADGSWNTAFAWLTGTVDTPNASSTTWRFSFGGPSGLYTVGAQAVDSSNKWDASAAWVALPGRHSVQRPAGPQRHDRHADAGPGPAGRRTVHVDGIGHRRRPGLGRRCVDPRSGLGLMVPRGRVDELDPGLAAEHAHPGERGHGHLAVRLRGPGRSLRSGRSGDRCEREGRPVAGDGELRGRASSAPDLPTQHRADPDRRPAMGLAVDDAERPVAAGGSRRQLPERVRRRPALLPEPCRDPEGRLRPLHRRLQQRGAVQPVRRVRRSIDRRDLAARRRLSNRVDREVLQRLHGGPCLLRPARLETDGSRSRRRTSAAGSTTTTA